MSSLDFFSCFLFVCLCSSSGAVRRHPVIYIPGDGGSRLEAKMDPNKVAPLVYGCPLKTYWHLLWLDVYQLTTSFRVKCWADEIKLVYDYKDGKNKNVPGVTTRVPGWGETPQLEYIDPSWLAWAVGDVGNVAATLVNHMTSKWGYKRGFDVRGAPYDFRFAPQSQAEYFIKLKQLIVDTYEKTGERVVLLTHSLGGVYGLHFLNSLVDAEWKRRYIHAFVPAGSPWAGSAVTFNLYVAGDSRGIKSVDPKVIREEQRSYETGLLLLPSQSLWPEKGFVFASTPTRNFTTENYDQFFADIDYPVGKINHDYVKNLTAKLEFPGVSVYCIYGRGINTPKKMVYSDSGFTNGEQPLTKMFGDGDGTVNIESSQLCRRLTKSANLTNSTDLGTKAEAKMFEGIDHLGLIQEKTVFQYLEKIFMET